MRSDVAAPALFVMLSILPGCGSGPAKEGPDALVGTWILAEPGGTQTLVFDASGHLTDSFTDLGMAAACEGAVDLGPVGWTATSSTVSLSGTATCSGTLRCTQQSSVQEADCKNIAPNALDNAETCLLDFDKDAATLRVSECHGTGLFATFQASTLRRIE